MKGILKMMLLSGLISSGTANAFNLISQEEYDQEQLRLQELGEVFEIVEKAITIDSPTIELIRPVLQGKEKLQTPLDIELKFVAKGDAEINMKSLKIKYGFINITKRVLNNAEVQGSSLFAAGAEVPEGSYTISVSISDTLKRTSKRKFKFEVVGQS